MGAIYRGRKQYFVEYESDRFNKGMYNRETGEYGSYIHDAGNAGTIKSAKSIIQKIRREHAGENPRNFKVYDSCADADKNTNFVPCVYTEE